MTKLCIDLRIQDQPFFATSYKVNVTANSQLDVNPAAAVQATVEYLKNQAGPLESSASNWVGPCPFSFFLIPLLTLFTQAGRNSPSPSASPSATRLPAPWHNSRLTGLNSSSSHWLTIPLAPLTKTTTLPSLSLSLHQRPLGTSRLHQQIPTTILS